MKKLLTLKDIDYKDKKVFLRVDFNVVEDGKVIDKFRIKRSLPTINNLLNSGCSIVIASHNGRPEGFDKNLSLRPVAQVLADMIKKPVGFVDDCVGQEVSDEVKELKKGDVLLLENLRFHDAEEKNNALFAKSLASFAQVYIDDAFANAHRAHASMVGVPKYLPHAAGILMQDEYERLSNLMIKPKKPYLAVIGGAKISTKIEVLKNLIEHVDTLFIAGAMANTFLQAQGYEIGKSISEEDCLDEAKEIMNMAEAKGIDLILPRDLVVAQKVQHGVKHRTVGVNKILKDDIALDIGKETMGSIMSVVNEAMTIFWNGTLGYAEIPEFAWASRDMAHMMAIRKNKADTIIGGGDTAGFIGKIGMNKSYSFVSTGGGASLELLSGKKLPGLEALMSL